MEEEEFPNKIFILEVCYDILDLNGEKSKFGKMIDNPIFGKMFGRSDQGPI